MRKGFVDMWMMIGILMMLLVFSLLLYFQQTGQNFLAPELQEVKPLAGLVLARYRK